tara:strand:+ start:59 stop:496 length:438 start_codon:yes stop_codon:yes gene_type:complete
MNKNDMKVRIGEIGEEVVNESFEAAVRASNWYDEEKDGIINNFTYEVKTQTINNRDNGFWQEQNQWKKLDGVDIFYIVKVPDMYESEGLIVYKVLNHYTNFKVITHNNRKVRVYPLKACFPMGIVRDKRAREALELSKKLRNFKF